MPSDLCITPQPGLAQRRWAPGRGLQVPGGVGRAGKRAGEETTTPRRHRAGRRWAVTPRGPARGADSAGGPAGWLPPRVVPKAAATAPGHLSRALEGPRPPAPHEQQQEGQQDERGHGAQRGEPQHPGDEQPRHLALLRAGHRAPPRRAAQHPLRERPCCLDPHQPHPQHGHVHLPAHGEGDTLRDPGPGQGKAADPLGADGLRGSVHSIAEVPDHHPHCAVLSHQLLHQVRPDPFHRQHCVFDERAHPQAAPAPRSPDFWNQ